MKKYVFVASILAVCLLCLHADIFAQNTEPSFGGAENIVQAKIGIRVHSDETIRRAKSEDRINAGTYLRIYVQPEFDDAMVYVLSHSQQQVVPLYKERRGAAESFPIILPQKDGEYRVDGQSSKEKLTIICSPKPLVELEDFLQAQTKEPQPLEAWEELEQNLIKQSKLDLSEDISRPWGIAGAVRGLDPFVLQLPIFSGKTFVIKTYEFLVEE